MKSNKINLALEALETIENNESLKALLATSNISLSEETFDNELLNDGEDTINDYIMMCGYTEDEAIAAYNELKNY
tara:strand:- start:1296 stop:1520 length:225 start_codon:yes stop_codon:yes gene_type:complete